MSQPKREAFVILFFTSNGASLNGRQSTFIHPCLVGFDPHTIDFQGLLPLCQGRNGHVTSCSRRGKCESYCKATQRYPAVELCIFGDVGSCSAMLLLRWYTQIFPSCVRFMLVNVAIYVTKNWMIWCQAAFFWMNPWDVEFFLNVQVSSAKFLCTASRSAHLNDHFKWKPLRHTVVGCLLSWQYIFWYSYASKTHFQHLVDVAVYRTATAGPFFNAAERISKLC